MSTKSLYIFGPEDRSVEGKAIGAIINDRLCLPILKELYLINDGNYKTNIEILNNLSSKINLEGPDLQAHGNNGNEFEYRAKWALNHLKNIDFVNKDQDRTLSWKITSDGIDFLKRNEIIENDNFEIERFNLIFKELKNLINVQYEGKKYWALGFGSGDYYTRLEKFKNENYWQALDYDESDNGNTAKKARQKFNQIKVSDFIIIKGYGGNHDIVVHYKGKVKEIIPSEYKLILEKTEGNLYNGKAPKGQGAGNWRDTIVEVKRKEDINLLFFDNSLPQEINTIIESEMESIERNENLDIPLNQILYGPPGTGKTYDTINKAISIINPDFNLNQNRKIIKEEFDRIEKESNILFSTFHQSMSYEDFIEGIKPLPPLPNEVLNYDIQAGIFKIACARAAYLCYKKYNKVNDVTLTPYSFEDLYYAFIESIKPSIKKGIFPTYKTLTGKDVEIYEINSQDSIKARAKGSIATHVAPLTQDNLEKLYNKFKDISEIKSLDLVREAVQVSPRITEFYAVFGGLKDFESTFKLDNEIIEEDILVDTTDDLEKVKKFTSGIYTEAIKQFGYEAEPVVLIIDEINRGNVSAIFGELITLIEHDKRIGATNEIRVKLPYSKKEFGVPPNLYIIGTMNTADRSVEALDTALRRRFSFVEMPPKYDLEELANEVYGYPLKDILETINKRIVRLLNNDHAIGHSYFLNKDEDSIIESFNRNIIPLLQEYFFGDYGKMMLVLGDGFVTYDEWKDEEKFFASYTETKNDYDVKDLYSIKNYKTVEKEGFAEALKKLMNR